MSRKLNRSTLETSGESSTIKLRVDKEFLRRDGKSKSGNVVNNGNSICNPSKFVSVSSQKRTAIVSPIFRKSDNDNERKHYKPVVPSDLMEKTIILKKDTGLSGTKDNYKHTMQNNFISKDSPRRNCIKLDRSKLKLYDSPDPTKHKCQTLPASTNRITKSELLLKRKLSVDPSPVRERFYASTPKDQSDDQQHQVKKLRKESQTNHKTSIHAVEPTRGWLKLSGESFPKQKVIPLTKQSKNIPKNVAQPENSSCNLGSKGINFKFKSLLSNLRNSVPKAPTPNKPAHGKNKGAQSSARTKYEPIRIELNKDKNTRIINTKSISNTSLEKLHKGVSSWVQLNCQPSSKYSSRVSSTPEFLSDSIRGSNSSQSDYKSPATKDVSSKKERTSRIYCPLSSAHSKITQTRIPSTSKHQSRQAVSSNETFETKVGSVSHNSQNFPTVHHTSELSSLGKLVSGFLKTTTTLQTPSNVSEAKSQNIFQRFSLGSVSHNSQNFPTMHHTSESCSLGKLVSGPLNTTTTLQTPPSVLETKSQSMFQNVSLKVNESISSIPNISQNSEEQNVSEESDVEMMDVSENLQSLDILNAPMEVDALGNNRKSYVFVVDTNMLIHDLNFIDELKDTPLEGCGPPYIYIPWIVICELDRLKTENNTNKFKIIRAVRFVFFMFNSKHPRIKGQTAQHSNELSRCFGTTGDDVLLSYCSWLTEKVSKDKVCLLTNDKNLCNKAFMNGIKVFTQKTLYENIKPDVSVVQETMDDSDPLCQFNNSTNETNAKDLKEQMEVDAIICEAKRILKNILEPFLIESMNAAFGESSKTFLTPPPSCLLDIFMLYKKYWLSVFGIMFERKVKQKIETLLRLFSYTRGFFCSVDDAFAALIAIEYICNAIMRRNPTIRPHVKRISELTDKCKALFKTEDDKVDVAEKSGNEIVMAVFTHIWQLIHHLCGMMLDFSQIPHNLQYDKPDVTPSAMEHKLLMPNLFPAIHLIKQSMSKIINNTDSAEPGKKELEYKRLYDYLIQFVPSLQIPAEPPATEHFTVQRLKAFCNDPECREHFKTGYQELLNYQKMLIDCLRLPIWKA